MRPSCAGQVAFINRHFRRGPTGRDTASALAPNTNEVRAATVTSQRRVHGGSYCLPLLSTGVSRTSGSLIPGGGQVEDPNRT